MTQDAPKKICVTASRTSSSANTDDEASGLEKTKPIQKSVYPPCPTLLTFAREGKAPVPNILRKSINQQNRASVQEYNKQRRAFDRLVKWVMYSASIRLGLIYYHSNPDDPSSKNRPKNDVIFRLLKRGCIARAGTGNFNYKITDLGSLALLAVGGYLSVNKFVRYRPLMVELNQPHTQNNTSENFKKVEYSVYTRGFDQEVSASECVDNEELLMLRSKLDEQVSADEGLYEQCRERIRSCVQGLVTSTKASLRRDKDVHETNNDISVTILIDNSGSMRGRPILLAAACADFAGEALEQSGVRVEILGFTTRAWKGGKSRQKWLENGKPRNPGRLNDLRHIVYKPADTPWQAGRTHLSLMLKDGILKENIDGEALQWAYSRICKIDDARKILIVISDGAPVDDATLSVNHKSILTNHLREVVDWIEKSEAVDLVAVGIGHDVSRYYAESKCIQDFDELAATLTELIEERIAAYTG